MSNDTKRDVFVNAVDALADAQASGGNIGHQDANLFMAEYEKALPDDLPVIPKDVSEYVKKAKASGRLGLLDVFWHRTDHISAMGYNGMYDWERWMVDNQDAVSRAWLDGVCIVEETGEIVKLEDEK